MNFKVRRETIATIARDRLRLDADVYFPESEGEFPVLLMRQPYGRKIASTVVYAHPRWYAAQGYIVAIQDVRGRGTSEGEFKLFEAEMDDGVDAVYWAAQLPHSNGQVGMYGFSYQGMTQLYAASQRPQPLKTICPATIACDLYRDWAYENGAFCLAANLGWAIQLAAETARRRGEEGAFVKLLRASRDLPLCDRLPAYPQILHDLAPDSFYHDWIGRSPADEYWQRLSPASFVDTLDLPMLHIGGWFDPYLRGTLKFYDIMAARSPHAQRLVIGPWAHFPWGQHLGAKDYGPAAASFVDRLQLAWFDCHLKGISSELIEKPPVCLFEMGSNQWQYSDCFPQTHFLTYYLQSDGLAAINALSGKLAAPESATDVQQEDTFVHDPWRPVPVLGGHAALPAGSFERSHLDDRTDVATYSSPPLTDVLSMVGSVEVELFVLSDSHSFDLSAILSEVRPDGRVFTLTQGYKRIDNGEYPVRFALQAIAVCISRGHRLRLSLSGSCFPAYPVNSGTGQHPRVARAIDAQIITLSIQSGLETPSLVRIPRR